MVDVVWRRVFPGRNPSRVLVGDECIVFNYIVDQGEPGTPGPSALVSYSVAGEGLFRYPDHRALAALDGDRFVAADHAGGALLLEGRGRVVARLTDSIHDEPLVLRAMRRGDRLLLETAREMLVSDLELRVLDRVPRPVGDSVRGPAFVGDGFVWLASGSLMRSDREGRARVLTGGLVELAEAELRRFEEATGTPALGDAFPIGKRMGYTWYADFEHESRLVHVTNKTYPHVVMCLDLEGTPRWARYIGPFCCGDTPRRLPNGNYVAASSCNGFVAWLGPDGRELFRTDKDNAVWGHARVLPDSRCLVTGEGGLFAYGPDGKRLWTLAKAASQFDCNVERDLLAILTWQRETGADSTVTLEVRSLEQA